jgi:hypothetical protein
MRHANFVENDLVPYLRELSTHTLDWVTNNAAPIQRIFRRNSGVSLESFSETVRHFSTTEDLALGLQALAWIERIHTRARNIPSRSLVECTFALNVGDVVVNKQLGHLGVVAARLPICFESDAWIKEHLGSLQDPRLSAPWYLILVGCHRGVPGDFSRYGSELTHERVNGVKSIGLNRHLPLYFRGFDSKHGRYIPRG